METLNAIMALREALEPYRRAGKSIGLVPTMGALHQGHLALIKRARAENDCLIATIFVNPTQFGASEDLTTYPRTITRDKTLLQTEQVDLLFQPSAREIYPEPGQTFVEVVSLSDTLIGKLRPGHFRGVTTVVSKLLNLCQPTRAYFGEKDFQQLTIIQRMVSDLDFPVEIVPVPTEREADGLACSSRNARLTPDQRLEATCLHEALIFAEQAVAVGERGKSKIESAIWQHLSTKALAIPKSVDLCELSTLAPCPDQLEQDFVVLLTVKFGEVLLLDQRVISLPNSSQA